MNGEPSETSPNSGDYIWKISESRSVGTTQTEESYQVYLDNSIRDRSDEKGVSTRPPSERSRSS
jgi:hypothetical protein